MKRLAPVRGLWMGVGAALLLFAGHETGEVLPTDDPAILYTKTAAEDPVARLQKRLDAGDVRLQYEGQFGYLKSVLRELGVPSESQVLVFSKTSFQAHRISPRRPRAVYFNDAVTVGIVRSGDVLELAAMDPKQGAMFYTLDQTEKAKPRFYRQDVCLQCHLSPVTQGVPGLMVRSVTPDWNGFPAGSAAYISDHRSPLKERWGGWYVTGRAGGQEHMGNAVLERPGQTALPVSEETRNVLSLGGFLEPAAYLTPHSDIVALMVLEHESQMLNRITEAGWLARLGRPIEAAMEEVAEYALFSGEVKLTGPIEGTSGFAEAFARRGPRDAQGRSLYELDLRTRMMRFPCSFLVYSEAWDGMPAAVRAGVYRKMWAVLSGTDRSGKFAHLSVADRQAIVEILIATKKGLPEYWKL